MKLIEEKTSIVIQLVFLVFIVLSGIGIVICDMHITDHTNAILLKAITLNRMESERISLKLNSVRYLIPNLTFTLKDTTNVVGSDS